MMSHSTPHNEANDSIARRHETSDAHFKSVLLTGLGLLGIMVLGLLLSWGVYTLFIHYTAAPGTHAETLTTPDMTKQPPGPNLQPDPRLALIVLRNTEDSILTTYGWVKRDSGIVRIPVEKAIELLVKRGLPTRK